VQKLKFSGAGVSEECADEMEAWQTDEKRVDEVTKCEKEEKVQEGVVGKLKMQDLDGAVEVVEKSMEKCIKFKNEKCAEQLAPVVVGSVVNQLMQPQQQMMPLLVAEEPGCAVVSEEADGTLNVMEKDEEPLVVAKAEKKVVKKVAKKAAKKVSLVEMVHKTLA